MSPRAHRTLVSLHDSGIAHYATADQQRHQGTKITLPIFLRASMCA